MTLDEYINALIAIRDESNAGNLLVTDEDDNQVATPEYMDDGQTPVIVVCSKA